MKNKVSTWHQWVLFLALLSTHVILGTTSASAASWLDLGKEVLRNTTSGSQSQSSLPTSEIVAGLKDALKVGTDRVVAQLGRPGGFNADPAIHIPLPGSLENARGMLDKVGMAAPLNDLELRLNRAAEEATPKAKELFLQAISEMTLEDARAIYNGPQDSATRYFQKKMSPELAAAMRPVVEKSLADVGAVKTYDQVMGQYRTLPFVPDIQTDLTGYVVDKGMAGIFHYLAIEEIAIRQDPAKRTTELLRKVFGSP
jgi:hypothetical protein